jgi:pimeloyl-ACP methyl ester carboxylesterase
VPRQRFSELQSILEYHQQLGADIIELEPIIANWSIAGPGSATYMEFYGKQRVSQLAWELHHADPRTLNPVLEGDLFGAQSVEHILSNIHCRCHLLAADPAFGGVLDRNGVEKVSTLIPDCSYEVINKVGHDIHVARPKQYAEKVLDFISNFGELA